MILLITTFYAGTKLHH